MAPMKVSYAAAASPRAMWRPSLTVPPVARRIGGDGGLPNRNNADKPSRQRPRAACPGLFGNSSYKFRVNQEIEIKGEYVNSPPDPAKMVWGKELGKSFNLAKAEFVSHQFTTKEVTEISGTLQGSVL